MEFLAVQSSIGETREIKYFQPLPLLRRSDISSMIYFVGMGCWIASFLPLSLLPL